MSGGNKHLEMFNAKHALDGEVVVAWAGVFRDKEGFEGAAILTDRRVCFVRKGTLSDKFEPWPIARISSVEGRRGILFYDASLHTSGDDMVLRFPVKQHGEQFISALQRAISGQATSAADAPALPQANPAFDPLDALKRLGELRDAGVVTDEEFAAKKADLLAKI